MDQQSSGRLAQRRVRGIRRIALILDAAEVVFAEIGYDEVTTNRIAAQADISPGSLYHFFANKEEIAQALADRYKAELEGVYHTIVSPEAVVLPISVWLDQIIQDLLHFHLAYPAFKVLFSCALPFLQISHLTYDLHQEVQKCFERGFLNRAPGLSQTQCTLSATMTIQSLKAVLPLALQAEETERTQLIEELRRMLSCYLESLLQ